VLGNPLQAAWATSDPERRHVGVELQFGREDANPRIIAIELEGGGLRIRLRSVAQPPLAS
jgi:hypothetical protein